MIYFVRHGQTDWNLEKKIQGRVDISLNKTGILQAQEINEKLKDVKFDYVFCSPLKRAKETCNIITDNNIIFDDRIIERDFGEFEGVKKTDFDFKGFWHFDKDYKSTRSESVEQVKDRVYNFLDEIMSKYNGKNILIVAHGGIGVFVSSYFNGIPSDGNFLRYLVDNGQILMFNNDN